MKIYESTRDAIYETLLSVSGIGKVFSHQRFPTDLKMLFDMYTVPHPLKKNTRLACVAWITRIAQTAVPSWAADEAIADIRYTSTWKLTLLYGFEDSEEPQFSSEYAFQLLVDNVVETFDFDSTLGSAVGVERCWPIEVISAVTGSTEMSEILCHRAEMLLRVEHVAFE